METRHAYNNWASQYDRNVNRTRDLEGVALREKLSGIRFGRCLEVGCGTGKNTVWLAEKARRVTAVDFSEEMLAVARAKVARPEVQFAQADINAPWDFAEAGVYDLVSFSLVLEHIRDLGPVFGKAAAALRSGGYLYIGELHPFKQYAGTKARFDTEEGRHIVECFNHHVSDFTQLPLSYGFSLLDVDEYFDNDDRYTIPRIFTALLQKT
ncbi:class I SAM-dependent methyltransferase [Chitinophaga lutea]